MAQDELITGAVSGVSFNTLTIDMPVYLLYLLRKFQEARPKGKTANRIPSSQELTRIEQKLLIPTGMSNRPCEEACRDSGWQSRIKNYDYSGVVQGSGSISGFEDDGAAGQRGRPSSH